MFIKRIVFLLTLILLAGSCPILGQEDSLSAIQKEVMKQEAAALDQLKQKQEQEQKAAQQQAGADKQTPAVTDDTLAQGKYDVEVISQAPDEDPQAFKAASAFNPIEGQDPVGTPAQRPDLESELGPKANPQIKQDPAKVPKQGFALVANAEELQETLTPVPEGTLAVYIDIEEAFNQNPWTIQARKNIKLELETKQLEFIQLKQQLQELQLKEKNLAEEIKYYNPFYNKAEYIAAGDYYPKLQKDNINDILNNITFFGIEAVRSSPENTPEKIKILQKQIADVKKAAIEKETFLLNYRELSREEVLSRRDYITQQILKEIYSGIKEYSSLRNIGLVVDKKDLVFGTPLNVTPEFVKWMKRYHKKYIKENGDIL